MKLHKEITWQRLEDAVKESMFGNHGMTGFCNACGEDATCEPDAERYRCECCGKREVYGAEQLLLLTQA